MADSRTTLLMGAKDPYKGHVPRALVIVGGQIVVCESFDLTVNDKSEVNTARIRIPLDNIDSSVFANKTPKSGMFNVQIWAGYLEDKTSAGAQLLDVAKKILGNEKQPYLSKRFEGYVIQPEWTYGNQNYLDLSCADWTNILREAKYMGQPIKGGACEAKSVLKAVQRLVPGIKINVLGKPPTKFLGAAQQKTKSDKKAERVYNPYGKNLFEIIQEVAREIEYRIYVDGTNINLLPPIKKPIIWEMYYGSKNSQNNKDLKVGQFFNELRFRYGAKGRSGKSNVAVKVYFTTKKGDKTEGKSRWFPDESNFAGADETYVIHHTIPGIVSEQYAKNLAKHFYNEKLKTTITGDVALDFANNFMEVGHAVTFVNDGNPTADLSFLNGIWFSISSISESYNNSGYRQQVEFESDYAFDQAIKQIAPPKGKGKK